MNTDLQYQYYDLQIRPIDPYGGTKYKILLKLLEGLTPQTILNIGSGFGELSIQLAQRGHTVVSIEPESEFYEHAVKAAQAARLPNCEFIQTTFENFQTDKQFDWVLAIDVIEHIKDDIAAFQKLAGLLNPSGTCFATVPALPFLAGNHDQKLHHYRRYTRHSLTQRIAPFLKIKSLRYFGFTLIPIAIIYSKILRRYYPISQSSPIIKEGVVSKFLRLVLRIDAAIPFFVGTSLILVAKPKENAL